MLFMVTHTHTLSADAVDESARRAALRRVLATASQAGVVVRGMYANAPAHKVYTLLEASNAEQIAAVFDPIREYGTIESAPVSDLLEL